MTKRTTRSRNRQPVEQYTGSLAELAIAATKANRQSSWEELAAQIRQQLGEVLRPRPRVPGRPGSKQAEAASLQSVVRR